MDCTCRSNGPGAPASVPAHLVSPNVSNEAPLRYILAVAQALTTSLSLSLYIYIYI